MNKIAIAVCAISPFLAFAAEEEPKDAEVSQSVDTNGMIRVLVEGDSMENSYVGFDNGSYTRLEVDPSILPFSVQQITPLLMQDTGVVDFNDAVAYLPGVYVDVSASDQNAIYLDRVYSRGFSTVNPNRDGMRIPQGNRMDILTLESIDFVKGPNSLQLGFNEVGGAINFVTKGAHIERPYQTTLLQTVTDTGRFRSSVESGGKVSDKYASLVAVNYQDGRDWHDLFQRKISVNFAQFFQFTEDTSLDLRMAYSYEKRDIDAGTPIVNGQTVGSIRHNWLNVHDHDYGAEFNSFYLNAVYRHDFNDQFTFRSRVTAHAYDSDWNAWRSSNYDAKTGVMTSQLCQNQFMSQAYLFKQELEWKNEDLEWLKSDMILAYDIGFSRYDYKGNWGENRGGILKSYADGRYEITKYPSYTDPCQRQWTYNSAPTLNEHLTLFDKWHVIGGLRYDHYDSWTEDSQGSKKCDTDWTYSVGTSYELLDWLHPYTSYATSFQPQSSRKLLTGGGTPDPSRGEQYEVGFKMPLFDEKLLLTACWFNIDRTHILENDPSDPTGTYVIDSGEQRSQGVELSAHGSVGKYFDVMASYANCTVESRKYDTTRYFLCTPKHCGNVWVVYRKDGVGQPYGFRCGVGVRATSSRRISNSDDWKLDAYCVGDLMSGYGFKLPNGHLLDFQLNVYNVADHEYFTRVRGVKGEGSMIGYAGPPLGAMFSVKYTF